MSTEQMAPDGNGKLVGKLEESRQWEIKYLSSKSFPKVAGEDMLKKDILKLCKHLKIETVSDFYDLIFKAQRNHCSHGAWGGEGNCWDDLGKDVAFSLEGIKKVFKTNKCKDVCKLGCCAKQNKLAMDIAYELAERAADLESLKELDNDKD